MTHILITIIIIVAVVVIISLLIWAAVALQAMKTQQEIMKDIKNNLTKFDE